MRQIIYDKVKYIADKYKGYIDTEDLMKEGLTNRLIGLLTAEGKLEKVAHDIIGSLVRSFPNRKIIRQWKWHE